MSLSQFRRWWRGKKPSLPHLEVILYTRKGCHLCEDALRQLKEAQRHYGFQVRSIDIDDDANLVAKHGQWVPVIEVNGKVRFRGRINLFLLDRLLRAEAERAKQA